MANEILALDIQPLRGRGEIFRVLFLYAISPTIDVNGVTVVPTPEADLPAEVTTHNLLSAGELNALNDGSAMFEIHPIPRLAGETNAQMIVKAQTLYSDIAANRVARLRRKYAVAGTRQDA